MKTKLALATLAALGGFAAFAAPASANPSIHVSFGFNRPAPAPYYRDASPTYCAPTAPVVVGDHYDNYNDNNRYDHHRPDYRPAGYWKEIVVKSWVPARGVRSHARHGRHVRVLEPGYFAFRTDRVWVGHRG